MRGFALPLSAVNVFKACYIMQQIKLMRHNPEKLRHDSALDVLTLLRLTAFLLHTAAHRSRAAFGKGGQLSHVW